MTRLCKRFRLLCTVLSVREGEKSRLLGGEISGLSGAAIETIGTMRTRILCNSTNICRADTPVDDQAG